MNTEYPSRWHMEKLDGWLVLDGHEDEPAAFGVPNYVGFHIRYICGVLEERGIEYTYMTVDQWRRSFKSALSTYDGRKSVREQMSELDGAILLAGAVVPGKYIRGTPISRRETDSFLSSIPNRIPVICGGWAIRHWRQSGWVSPRANLFCSLKDVDATLNHFLSTGNMNHKKRSPDEWSRWALRGASSKAVVDHPDLLSPNGSNGPLTYEVELYQGCVRFKRGCKFCIEPKKGLPLWREEDDVIKEINAAVESGIVNVRIGGATDIYTYRAEGVEELEYPIPDPEPISKVLQGARNNESLQILHVDNANPSIVAQNIEPSTEITKSLVENLSDGAVLSFGLESADPKVHDSNWLNCDSDQLKIAIRHINEYGRERGPRGLPKLLPGLNFIAGLNGETERTYEMNISLLNELKSEGLWLRRINIRQVEGKGFQEIPENEFRKFKTTVREEIDQPMLEEILPLGTKLKDIWWESRGGRIRLPEHVSDEKYRNSDIHGDPGITFGRQIGAYPILVGVPYAVPLESGSDIIVTGHGMRSISGIECGLDINSATKSQLQALPGIGDKASWKIISNRARRMNKNRGSFKSVEEAFSEAGVKMPPLASEVFVTTY